VAPGVTKTWTPGAPRDEWAVSASEFLKGESGGGQGTATGSGFEVDGSATILTNWHVVEGASNGRGRHNQSVSRKAGSLSGGW
jgi:S1-C subfamily serine protease